MKITLDENYYACTDTKTLGYVGEVTSRKIIIENHQCKEAESYKIKFEYPDGKSSYEVDITNGEYIIEPSILRRVGDVYVQILAGHYVNGKYDYLKKSNILKLHINRSLNGNPVPVPTYEKSVEALEKVLEAEKLSAENVSKAESASNAAQTAQNAAEKAAENAAQSERTAQSAAATATDKATEISKSAEQIQKNTDDIAKLYSKSDGIVCNAEGKAITLNDSAEMPFSGMKIFGRSTQDGTPSPDNPVPIVSVGDSGKIEIEVCSGNLLDISKTKSETRTYATGEQVRLINNGDGTLTVKGTTPESTYYVSSQLANVFTLPNGNYVLSCDKFIGNVQVIVRKFYDETQKNIILEGNTTTQYFTVNGDEKQIVFFMQVRPNSSVDVTFHVMLNRGEKALPWEPYKHQTLTVPTPNGLPGIPVDSDGNYTDENGQQWICDEIDLQRGVYVQRIDVFNAKDVNWSAAWNTISSIFHDDKTAVFNSINSKRYHNLGLCNVFTNVKLVDEKIGFSTNRGGGTLGVRVPKALAADLLKWNEYIQNNDIVFMLVQKPQCDSETPLTAEEIAAYKALHTNKPTTTITNSDNAHMAVSYTADTKAYIDNKFAELQAAIISTGGNV